MAVYEVYTIRIYYIVSTLEKSVQKYKKIKTFLNYFSQINVKKVVL